TTLSAPDTLAPAAPDSLRAVAGAGAVLLEWAPLSTADLGGYSVYREDATGVFQAIASRLDLPRYLDEGLADGQTYRYQVAAADAQHPPNESAPTAVVAATPNAGAVGDAPEIGGLEEGARPERPVVLINNAIPLDAGSELTYTVQVSTASDFTTIVDRGGLIAESLSGVTRWRLTRDLEPGVAYWFRARAMPSRHWSARISTATAWLALAISFCCPAASAVAMPCSTSMGVGWSSRSICSVSRRVLAARSPASGSGCAGSRR
ncbi:MAG: hypothetical protein QGH25_15215, partial [Candidatus Latescibacteria bacterium]|nr:hypothetical protein [Candidatus Latescibacterota bacterium]